MTKCQLKVSAGKASIDICPLEVLFVLLVAVGSFLLLVLFGVFGGGVVVVFVCF